MIVASLPLSLTARTAAAEPDRAALTAASAPPSARNRPRRPARRAAPGRPTGPGRESGRFGTGEFITWCAAAGVEPVLGLDMGTGSLDQALAWVEYANGGGDSYWACRRRVSGHVDPFGVRHWGLGREMYRRRTAAEYVAEARRWAAAIKRLDPDSSGSTWPPPPTPRGAG